MAIRVEELNVAVTGASKGIGAAIAKHLVAVVVNYASSKAGADKVVREITSDGEKAVAVRADVAKKAEIDGLFAETKKTCRGTFPGIGRDPISP
jgi:3-oxoacyl-[acyl-carrier protein] reductase